MLSKLKEYAANSKIREALIIGQNLFSQNPGDLDIFSAYYSVLWSVISSSENIDEKQRYFQQLSAVLAAFSEAVALDDSMIEYIRSKEDSLGALFADIQNLRDTQQREYIKSRVMLNEDCLKQISSIIDKLSSVTNKTEFDALLEKIQECDASFDKEYLSGRQKEKYEAETRRCSQIVDQKVRYFEREKNVVYNMRALEAYEKVFAYFKGNKAVDAHKDIIRGLFEFDLTKLFNETLTYYNYVYSYVLSKLSDEEKFVLTKAAIHSQFGK